MGGCNIARKDALGLVAGYSVFNDASIREYQKDDTVDRGQELRRHRRIWT
jgi:2-keto-4-pentenoate hydratase/2-oxohepta-3-ene-1,7-dioic acid hydratase in catechol pathway